ncbi:hypothetical protein ACWCXE_21095 [Streptomyces sp. NPDC001780]
MVNRQEQDANFEGHYEECPAHPATEFPKPCRCEAITREAEDYYTEPADMAAREWGTF